MQHPRVRVFESYFSIPGIRVSPYCRAQMNKVFTRFVNRIECRRFTDNRRAQQLRNNFLFGVGRLSDINSRQLRLDGNYKIICNFADVIMFVMLGLEHHHITLFSSRGRSMPSEVRPELSRLQGPGSLPSAGNCSRPVSKTNGCHCTNNTLLWQQAVLIYVSAAAGRTGRDKVYVFNKLIGASEYLIVHPLCPTATDNLLAYNNNAALVIIMLSKIWPLAYCA